MSNLDFLKQITQRSVRQLDFGDYSPQLKGTLLDVWVNAPGVVENYLGGRAFTEFDTTDAEGKVTTERRYAEMSREQEYENMRRVVSILYEWDAEQVKAFEDTLLEWLFGEGLRLRREYLEELRKN